MAIKIKAAFFDLTGTLYEKGEWIPGAKETIDWLIGNNIKIRFVTNTTMTNRHQLKERFNKMGLDVREEWFFTPALSAVNWFARQKPKHGILPLVHSSLLSDLKNLPFVDKEPADYILVGDMDDEWNIQKINRAFRALMSGAELTALQKYRYWNASDGCRLDTGAHVAALEYASQKKCAVVFGKPNPVFYRMALDDVDAAPEKVIMVGDDLDNDIIGAQKCGIRGVLVRTGKFNPEYLSNPEMKPDNIIDSVKDLPGWIDKFAT